MNDETLNKLKELTASKNDFASGEPAYRMWAELLLACGDELIALAERTTSPVSQMTDAEIIEKIDRPGFAWENLDAAEQRNLLDSIRAILAAAAPHAQAPAAQQESIDTPEFQSLLIAARLYGDDPTHYTEGKDALVAHIDAHTAAAVATAREEGCTELRRQDHEQACRITHALMADRDEWKARATAAESKLEAIRRGVEGLTRCDADSGKGDGVWEVADGDYLDRDQVLAIFTTPSKADEPYPTRECAAEALTPSVGAPAAPVAEQGELPRYSFSSFTGCYPDVEGEWVKLSDARAAIAALQERYDCNTAIMHARTRKMNEYATIAASQQAAEPVAWRTEFIVEAAKRSGFIRSDACCSDPLKFCEGDHWKGNIEGFAKAMVRLAAPAIQQPQDGRAAFEAVAGEDIRHGQRCVLNHEGKLIEARAALAKKGGA